MKTVTNAGKEVEGLSNWMSIFKAFIIFLPSLNTQCDFRV